MKIVLDIENERDWQALLPLLERLKISFTKTAEPKKNGHAKTNGKHVVNTAREKANTEKPKRNYDLEKLERLFKEAHALNAFAAIDDPVAWQKQLRDEWD